MRRMMGFKGAELERVLALLHGRIVRKTTSFLRSGVVWRALREWRGFAGVAWFAGVVGLRRTDAVSQDTAGFAGVAGFAGCGVRPFWLFRVRHNARSLANSRRRELSALLRKAQRGFPQGSLATQNFADHPFESCQNLAHF